MPEHEPAGGAPAPGTIASSVESALASIGGAPVTDPEHDGKVGGEVGAEVGGEPGLQLEQLTMSASPGLIEDTTRPDLGPVAVAVAVAVLTVVFDVIAETRDPHRGAEVDDLIITAALRGGFALTMRHDPDELTNRPVLPGWTAEPTKGGLAIVAHDRSVFYEGDLRAAVPAGWRHALEDHGLLAVVLCSGVDLARADRTEQIAAAGHDGRAFHAEVTYNPPPTAAGRRAAGKDSA